MKKTYIAVLGLTGAVLAAQSVPRPSAADLSLASDPFSPSSLSLLSSALTSDLKGGNIEWAQLHVMQLQMAALGAQKVALAVAATEQGTPSAEANTQIASLRAQFAHLLKPHPLGILPDNPAISASLVPEALRLQQLIDQGDTAGSATAASNLLGTIARLSARLLNEQIRKTTYADPDLNELNLKGAALRDAVRSDDFATAAALANPVLQLMELLRQRFGATAVNGSLFFDAYDALGRAAFNRGDYEAAVADLLKAATSPGGPALGTFGPSLKLADKLLTRGYPANVIEFLTACKAFWNSPLPDLWISQIEAGQHPDFKPNLSY